MAMAGLPEGFRWTWSSDSVRIGVPPILRTGSHAYEPVLSRRDAEAVAEAVARHEKKREVAGASRLLRVRIAHDPGYSPLSLARFRMKLGVSLIEFGLEVAIDDTTSRTGVPVA